MSMYKVIVNGMYVVTVEAKSKQEAYNIVDPKNEYGMRYCTVTKIGDSEGKFYE